MRIPLIPKLSASCLPACMLAFVIVVIIIVVAILAPCQSESVCVLFPIRVAYSRWLERLLPLLDDIILCEYIVYAIDKAFSMRPY